MSANSSYVNLGDENYTISEPPRFPILLVAVALILGGVLVWWLKGKGD